MFELLFLQLINRSNVVIYGKGNFTGLIWFIMVYFWFIFDLSKVT